MLFVMFIYISSKHPIYKKKVLELVFKNTRYKKCIQCIAYTRCIQLVHFVRRYTTCIQYLYKIDMFNASTGCNRHNSNARDARACIKIKKHSYSLKTRLNYLYTKVSLKT